VQIFHHNDLDGRCAAAIIYWRYHNYFSMYNHEPRAVEVCELDYKDDFPFSTVDLGDEVWIVDYSLKNDAEWNKLLELTDDITWIDHHSTAILSSEGKPWRDKLNTNLSTEGCGAKLTWEHIYDRNSIRSPVVELVDLWDRWLHKDDPKVIDFVNGMLLEDTHPFSVLWGALLDPYKCNEPIEKISNNGKIIGRYNFIRNGEYNKQFGYSVTFEGYKCYVCNIGMVNSKFFDARTWSSPDIFIAWVKIGDRYRVSLYSEIVKVNDIAVKYGGGGHPGAAGFVSDILPF
jgi:uncharacterized protein